MFTVPIEPILFKYGIFEVRYYGLAYAFAFLLVYYFIHKNKKELGLDSQKVDNVIIAFMVGIIVGARIGHFLIDRPMTLIQNPLEFFMIWHGGMSFFGGFLGLLIAGYLITKKYHVNFLKLADIVAVPSTLGLIFGRIANLINQELVGTVTSVPWCFQFENHLGCRHPYQIYAAISHLLLFLILVYITTQKSEKKYFDGIVFYSFIIGYSLFRFIVDFFREDLRFLGITSWQYISIMTFFIGAYFLRQKLNKSKK